jgi:hypothetical protein
VTNTPIPEEDEQEPLEREAARGRSGRTPFLAIGAAALIVWSVAGLIAAAVLLIWFFA